MELEVELPMEDIVAQVEPSLLEPDTENEQGDSAWVGGDDALPSFGDENADTDEESK